MFVFGTGTHFSSRSISRCQCSTWGGRRRWDSWVSKVFFFFSLTETVPRGILKMDRDYRWPTWTLAVRHHDSMFFSGENINFTVRIIFFRTTSRLLQCLQIMGTNNNIISVTVDGLQVMRTSTNRVHYLYAYYVIWSNAHPLSQGCPKKMYCWIT